MYLVTDLKDVKNLFGSGEETELGQVSEGVTSIPKNFWVSDAPVTGKNGDGWGHSPGGRPGQPFQEYVVFKSWKGKYMSMNNMGGNTMMANRPVNGPWEKFIPISLDGNKFAFQAWN